MPVTIRQLKWVFLNVHFWDNLFFIVYNDDLLFIFSNWLILYANDITAVVKSKQMEELKAKMFEILTELKLKPD